MLNRALLILIILLQSSISFGQSSTIEELNSQLKNAHGEKKVDLLNELANLHLRSHDQKSYNYSIKAENLANEIDYTFGQVEAKIVFARFYKARNKEDKAIRFFEEAAKLSKGIDSTKTLAFCYAAIAGLKGNSYHFTASIEFFNKAIHLYNDMGDDERAIKMYLNKGNIYHHQGKLDQSIACFLKALKRSEKINHLQLTGSCLNNISVIYNNQNKYNEAINYLLKAEKLHKNNEDRSPLAMVYSNIGMNYSDLEIFDKSLEYYEKSLEISQYLNDTLGLASIHVNLGITHSYLNEQDVAIEHLLLSLDLAEATGSKKQIVASLKNLSYTYKLIGNADLAILYAQKSLELSEETQILNDIEKSHLNLSEGYKLKGDYKKAYEHFKIHSEYADSILNEQSLEAIDKLNIEYQTEKKDQEIKIKNAKVVLLQKEGEIEKTKTRFYIIIGGIVVLIAIGFIIFLRGKISSNKKVSDLEKESLTKDLNYKNKELTNLALHIVEKNEFLSHLSSTFPSKYDGSESSEVKSLIQQHLSVEKDRDEFKAHVDEISQSFFLKLDDKYPKLTKNEKRLCVLLRLDLSSKEISMIQNISPSSVDMNRHRLRKKMNISGELNISEFLNNI